MRMETVINVCGRCGAKISSDAPQGVCPACLLEAGLGLLYDEDENSLDHPLIVPIHEVGERFQKLCEEKQP
jgi:hypothetical protein